MGKGFVPVGWAAVAVACRPKGDRAGLQAKAQGPSFDVGIQSTDAGTTLGSSSPRLFFAAQDAQRAFDQRPQLVLARISHDGSDPFHIIGKQRNQASGVRHTSGQNQSINAPAQHGSHRADFLGDLVGHRVEHQLGFAVNGRDAPLDIEKIFCSQIRIQTSFAEQRRFHLISGAPAAEAQVDQLHHRHTARTLGRKRTLLARVGHVDHAAVSMCRDRDSAAKMRHDQPQRFIRSAIHPRIALRHGLGIQRMR